MVTEKTRKLRGQRSFLTRGGVGTFLHHKIGASWPVCSQACLCPQTDAKLKSTVLRLLQGYPQRTLSNTMKTKQLQRDTSSTVYLCGSSPVGTDRCSVLRSGLIRMYHYKNALGNLSCLVYQNEDWNGICLLSINYIKGLTPGKEKN